MLAKDNTVLGNIISTLIKQKYPRRVSKNIDNEIKKVNADIEKTKITSRERISEVLEKQPKGSVLRDSE
ncbi:MAG: hypothetical protein ACR2PH_08275 [Desulfobulbia bacterium]